MSKGAPAISRLVALAMYRDAQAVDEAIEVLCASRIPAYFGRGSNQERSDLIVYVPEGELAAARVAVASLSELELEESPVTCPRCGGSGVEPGPPVTVAFIVFGLAAAYLVGKVIGTFWPGVLIAFVTIAAIPFVRSRAAAWKCDACGSV